MKYKLEDLIELKTQGVNTTTDNIEYVSQGYKIVQAKNIQPYNITFDEKNYVSEKTYSQIKENHKLHKGDVLYTNIGSQLGNSAIYNSDEKAIITWNVMKLIPKKQVITNDFLCYLLNYHKTEIASLNSSSTMPFVSGKELMNFKIEVPSILIQHKITKVLKTIENKIKLNTKTNDNLLKIGLELLKEDFNKKTEYEVLSNAIKFVKGKKPLDITTEVKEGYKKYLTIACLNGQEVNYAEPTKMVLSNNDLLMVMDGASSGDVYYVGQGIVGSTLSRVDCIDGNYISEFVYFIMKYYKDLIQSKNTGSAIPHTDKVFVGNLKVPKLLIEEQEKYKTLLYKILKNMDENKILEQLRDTLLPKLMNGEIDLDKIEI